MTSSNMTKSGGGASDATPNKDQESLDFWVQLALWGAVAISLGVGITTLFGVKEVIASTSIISWISAITVTFVLTLIVAISWHQMIKLAAKGYGDPRKVAYILIFGIVMTGLMIGTTAQFLAGRIGGDAAMRHHKFAYLKELTSDTSVVEQQSRASEQRIEAGRQAGTRLADLFSGERNNGVISGSSGEGRVTRAITSIMDAFDGTQNSVSGEMSAQRTRLTEVRGQIEIARDAARNGDDDDFASAVAVAHSVLSEAKGKTSTDFLQSNPMVGSSIPQIAAIGAELAQTSRAIQVVKLSKPVPVFEDMERQEAVAKYSDKVAMSWVLAICLDALPLFLLCLTMLTAQIRRGENPAHAEEPEAVRTHPADHLFSVPGE